jgi:hypothetical protein
LHLHAASSTPPSLHLPQTTTSSPLAPPRRKNRWILISGGGGDVAEMGRAGFGGESRDQLVGRVAISCNADRAAWRLPHRSPVLKNPSSLTSWIRDASQYSLN